MYLPREFIFCMSTDYGWDVNLNYSIYWIFPCYTPIGLIGVAYTWNLSNLTSDEKRVTYRQTTIHIHPCGQFTVLQFTDKTLFLERGRKTKEKNPKKNYYKNLKPQIFECGYEINREPDVLTTPLCCHKSLHTQAIYEVHEPYYMCNFKGSILA